jgi:hypothetical protein
MNVPTFLNPIANPLKRVVSRKRRESIYRHTECIPIQDFSAKDDIFIVGYPKSGNTWLQNVVASLVYGVDASLAPDSIIQDLVPDVHYKRFYRRYATPMYFKSHCRPRPDYQNVIYLVRDGRDAMVSYYHYLKVLRGKRNLDISYTEMLRDRVGLFEGCKWHEHTEAWLANPYQARMLTIRYENMRSQPLQELRKLCDFINHPMDDENLGRIIHQTSVENMKAKEAKWGQNNPAWPKDKAFVRRGQSGSFKDEMPAEVLEYFLQESQPALEKLGYLA